MKEKLKSIIKLILALIFALQIATIYGQDIIPYSIYFNSQQVAINDPNLHFQYKYVKKGLKLSIRYKDAQLKTMIYKEELYLTDSIEIRLSSFAKKKDVDIGNCYNAGKFYVSTPLRRNTNSFYYSSINLYKSKKE